MAGWPWPLDGVQGFFEGLWNWIGEAARLAVAPVQEWINTGLAWLSDRVSEGLGGLWSQASKGFEAVKTWVTDGFKAAVDTITKGVTGLGTQISTLLADGFKATGDSLRFWGENLGRAVDTGVKNLAENLSGMQKNLAQAVSGAADQVITMFDGALKTIGDLVGPAITGLPNTFIAVLGKYLMENVNANLALVASAAKDSLVAAGRLGSSPPLTSVPVSPEAAEAFLEPHAIQIHQALQTFNLTLMMVETISLGQLDMTLARLMDIPGFIAASTIAQRIMTTEPFIGLLPAYEQAVLKEYMPMIPELGDASRMLWRGVVNEEAFKDVVARHGYGDPWAAGFLELTRNIPGPQDLITFVVREVLVPEEFKAWMSRQGFSAYWSDAYWMAHFRLPAYEQLVDAFHRGLISGSELDRYIFWHDYQNTPRPGITATDIQIMHGLIKTLVGRVDLRRGYELGALSFMDMVKRFEWLGYEDDSRLMAEIQARVAFAVEIGKLRDNAKADFVKGYIAEDELRRALKELGYSPDVVEYHVQDAVQDRRRSYLDDMKAYLKDAYVKNYITTEEDLEAELSKIIKIPDVVSLEVNRAYIQKKGKVKAG